MTKAVAGAASHSEKFVRQVQQIAGALDTGQLEELAGELAGVRERGGRLFLLGVGGSAANCSHAVNDFRKLCGIEAYAPTDNVSELTARINDEGWEGVFAAWLDRSRLSASDALMIFSVGGGDRQRGVSVNLINAIDFARERKAKVFGIVGRDGGYTGAQGDLVLIVPTVDDALVTPHAEAFQGVIWHCLVSNPRLQVVPTKW